MVEEPHPTEDPLPASPRRLGRLATAPAVASAAVVVAACLGLLLLAFLPRTIAVADDDAWRVQLVPGVVNAEVRVLDADGRRLAEATLSRTSALADARVLDGSSPGLETLIVGHAPRGAGSIRVAPVTGGTVEAELRRVAWRRIYVRAVAPGRVPVDLVAIDRRGRVVESADGVGSRG